MPDGVDFYSERGVLRNYPYETVFKPNRDEWPESRWDKSVDFLTNFERWSSAYEPKKTVDGEALYPVIFEIWARD